jgi:hypothetical protein
VCSRFGSRSPGGQERIARTPRSRSASSAPCAWIPSSES